MHRIVYMEWVKTRRRANYEIGGSGVIPVHIDELPEARESLDLNDFNLYGYRPLLNELAARYQVDPDQVVTAPGTSMANYLAVASLVKAGDEVLIEGPAYEPLVDVPRLLGCRICRFKRRFENGFRIDTKELASKFTEHTRLVILSNLHNPSGHRASEQELAEVGEIARNHGAFVLVDEVYMDFLFEGRPLSSVHLGANFVMTCSLTKAYGLDGLRCGWAIGNSDVAKAMWRLQDFFGVNGAIPAEKTSVVALQRLERFVERTRAIMASNRPLVDRFMEQHREYLEWVPPDAGPVCFPRLRAGSAESLCETLREKFDVGVIPGHFFGMPEHFRIGFGGKTEDLRTGLDRLSECLSVR